MMFAKLVLVVFLPIYLAKPTDVTFKNATFREDQTFRKTIRFSNSLKDFLQGFPYVDIKFSFQNIPVLYKGSLADVHLNDLELEGCGIYKIQPGSLTNSSMRKFSIKGNKIKKIEKDVFNKVNVSWIDLSHNRITTIHSNAFNNLHILRSIDLSYNKIRRWNFNWFRNTPTLSDVSLRKNSISQLPKHAFKNLGGIKIDVFHETVYMDIDLSYNKIKKIEPDAFNGLTEVKYLRLNNNRLKKFDEDLLQDVNVEYLYLNHNKIPCLEGDLAKIIKANETDLTENPLDCKCLSKIKDWIDQYNKTINIYLPSTVKCYL